MGLSTTRKRRTDAGQRATPSLAVATAMFRAACLEKWADEGRGCAKCGGPFSAESPCDVSHFFNVRKSGVRFDPRNVDPLHSKCHTGWPDGWEYQKMPSGGYYEYMVRKLGKAGLEELGLASQRHVSLDDAKAALVAHIRGGTLWNGCL
jgi:hypothetical protein